MKNKSKLLCLIIAVCFALFCSGVALAENVAMSRGYTWLVNTTTFNNVTTSFNTTGYQTLANQKTAFFVKYNETVPGTNVTLSVKPQVSQDNVNYVDMVFYDVGGTTTMQTTESITTNGTYYFWLPDTVNPPYTRVHFDALNTSASEVINISTYVVGSINPSN